MSTDDERFAELVRDADGSIRARARLLMGNAHDADDVVQETYLRAWRGIPEFRHEAKASTWLHTILTNTAATHLRRRQARTTDAIQPHHEPADPDAALDPEHHAELLSLSGRLAGALATLPAGQRLVIGLRLSDVSHDEAASELGITPNAAKVRLHRARRQLAAVLRSASSESTEHAFARRASVAALPRRPVH